MDFLDELSGILNETIDSLRDKRFQDYIALCDKHLPEPDKYRKINILKTILVGSKNYPNDDVQAKRKIVLAEFEKTEIEYCHEKRMEKFPIFLNKLNKLFREYRIIVDEGIKFKMFENWNEEVFDIFETRNDYMDEDSLIKSVLYNDLVLVDKN